MSILVPIMRSGRSWSSRITLPWPRIWRSLPPRVVMRNSMTKGLGSASSAASSRSVRSRSSGTSRVRHSASVGVLVGIEIVEFEHALIPGEVFLAHHPFPNADAAHLVGQRNALHQPVVLRLAAFEAADVLDLRDEVQRLPFGVAHQRDGQQRPNGLAVAADIAFLHGVAADVAVEQIVQLAGSALRSSGWVIS